MHECPFFNIFHNGKSLIWWKTMHEKELWMKMKGKSQFFTFQRGEMSSKPSRYRQSAKSGTASRL